jgi:hypothetical protein
MKKHANKASKEQNQKPNRDPKSNEFRLEDAPELFSLKLSLEGLDKAHAKLLLYLDGQHYKLYSSFLSITDQLNHEKTCHTLEAAREILLNKLKSKLHSSLERVRSGSLSKGGESGLLKKLYWFKASHCSAIDLCMSRLIRSCSAYQLLISCAKYANFYNECDNVDSRDALMLTKSACTRANIKDNLAKYIISFALDRRWLLMGYMVSGYGFYLNVIERPTNRIVARLNARRDGFEPLNIAKESGAACVLLFYKSADGNAERTLIEVYDQFNLDMVCSRVLDDCHTSSICSVYFSSMPEALLQANVHATSKHIILFDSAKRLVKFYDKRSFVELNKTSVPIVQSRLVFADANDDYLVFKYLDEVYLMSMAKADRYKVRQLECITPSRIFFVRVKISPDSSYLLATASHELLMYDMRANKWHSLQKYVQALENNNYSKLDMNYLSECDTWMLNDTFSRIISFF